MKAAMHALFIKLHECLATGHAAVLVTVVASSGSTPRGAGARMLVTLDGRQAGTIGGGAVEYQCEQMARQVLQSHCSRMARYRLCENEIQDLGMICGGDVQVFFRYLPEENAALLALTGCLLEMFQAGEPTWWIEEITPGSEGALGLYGEARGLVGMALPQEALARLREKPISRLCLQGKAYYAEKLIQAGVVYVFGGGHVAQALVPILAAVAFRCVVLEDRQAYAMPHLFPGAWEVGLIDNRRVQEFVSIKADDAVIIMTRGHKDDEAILAQVLRTPARYIGVIGSRRKSAAMLSNLREMGFAQADVSRVTSPIGLPIGAETPAEIAVSIAAQLIQGRAAAHGALK